MKPSEIYWIAFILMAVVRIVFRYYPENIPVESSELITNEQIAFSFYGVFAYLFCIFATYKMFRSKGISVFVSLLNGAASVFYWAIVMIIQMIYIFNKKPIEKIGENEI